MIKCGLGYRWANNELTINVTIVYIFDPKEIALNEVSISEFKAKCLALLEQVRKTKQPLRVTRHGKPVAEIVPATDKVDRKEWIRSMQGSGKTLGDIIAPAVDEDDWEVLRD